MSFKHKIRKFLWKTGFDLSRFTPGENRLAHRRALFNLFQIDLVLDVGANTGQFARELRSDLGYSGRIVSFEPMRREFEELRKNAKGDRQWEANNYALGDKDEQATIHIAGNSLSSSLLEMGQSHIDAAPESKYVRDEPITVRKLDSVFGELHKGEASIFLKIDTQGFEGGVLKGAEQSLKLIDTVQMEMSLVPVYESEVLFTELIMRMTENGYYMTAIDEVFSNPKSGELLQIDGMFHRGPRHR